MNKVEEKLSELIDILAEQEEIQRFKKIEDVLKNNSTIQARIDDYKKMQKKVVLYENKNDDLPKEVSDKLDKAYNELFDIPIYNEFSHLQSDINELLQQLTFIIEQEINK